MGITANFPKIENTDPISGRNSKVSVNIVPMRSSLRTYKSPSPMRESITGL
jgi:hypothetical protein